MWKELNSGNELPPPVCGLAECCAGVDSDPEKIACLTASGPPSESPSASPTMAPSAEVVSCVIDLMELFLYIHAR